MEMARLNNTHQVGRSWANHWNEIQAPAVSTIIRNFEKNQEHGTTANLNKGNSGRQRTARSAESIQRVRRSLQRNGVTSARRNGLGLSRSSFSRIVRCDLRFHPYVLITNQALRPQDPGLRLGFCQWFVQNCESNANFLSNLITSDEEIFSLNSEVTTKNTVKYSKYGQGHSPDHYIGHQQGAAQVMVWVGLIGDGRVLGPHFIDGNIDSQYVQREFGALGINLENVWWQQDGVPAHTSNQSMHYLRGQFPGKVISKRGDVIWPPRSPDLAILDFFLWGYLKHKIWSVQRNQQPSNIEQLKESIRRNCREIPRNKILDSFQGMINRCNKCIEADGNTFADE